MWDLYFLRIHDAEDMKRDNNTHFIILLDSVYPDFVNQMLHVRAESHFQCSCKFQVIFYAPWHVRHSEIWTLYSIYHNHQFSHTTRT